jgi:hypothetical protein
MWMYVVLPVIALDYALNNDGWRQWLGALVLASSVAFWMQFFLKRNKGSSI